MRTRTWRRPRSLGQGVSRNSTWPWAPAIVTAWDPITVLPTHPNQRQATPAIKEGTRGPWNPLPPGPPAVPSSSSAPKSRSTRFLQRCSRPATLRVNHQASDDRPRRWRHDADPATIAESCSPAAAAPWRLYCNSLAAFCPSPAPR
jgi:hypothetical protein